MNIFIFQALQSRYDLAHDLRANKREIWYATRYRNEMHIGDRVYLWMGGDESIRGIYGWGELTSEPYKEPKWDTYGVNLVCRVRFSKPILAKGLKQNAALSRLLILRAPQASNFLLQNEEAADLANLVRSRGEEAP